MSDTIRVKLVRSPISTNQRVRETVKGLGLGKVVNDWTNKILD
jgi:ribosomal protein L30/L7E